MRIFSAIFAALALAACNQQPSDVFPIQNEVKDAGAATGEDRIECAHAGAADFTRDCSIERTDTANGLVLTVRHADNGFHRLLVVKDGRGVIAADGAEQAKVSMLTDGRIEVAIGGDRYRLPATVKAKAGK